MKNKLVSEICRILDFAEENYGKLAFGEAVDKGKLTDCYMIVNDRLEYVYSYDYELGLAIIDNGANITVAVLVVRLEVWNPESGIYCTSKGTFCLINKAKKQWKKSFSIDNYSIVSLYGNMSEFSPINLFKEEPVNIFETQQGDIYFLTQIIATKEEDEVYLLHEQHMCEELSNFLASKGSLCQIKL